MIPVALEVIHAHPRSARKGELGAMQRGISAAAGATLVLRGVTRRDLQGWLAIAAGSALILRGARGRGAGARAPRATPEAAPEPLLLSRCVTIGERPERILEVARRPERWLAGPDGHDLRVEGERWHLTVRALGRRVYELGVDVETRSDGSFGWRSVPDSPLSHEGCLRLRPAPDDRGTEARGTVSLKPEGALGRALGSALHGVAERALGQALHRLRQAVEVGEPARSEPQPHARRGLLVSVVKVGTEESS